MLAEPAPPELLRDLRRLVPAMQERATTLDAHAAYPVADMQAIRELGLLAVPLTDADPGLLCDILATLGQGNLSVGRLFEAHVNALQLVTIYGVAEQRDRVAEDVGAGHLFGLWVTDPPTDALVLDGTIARGRKGPCSGAGHVTRALVTVQTTDGTRMAVVAVDGTVHAEAMRGVLHGMRASASGTVRFDATPVSPGALIGQPGDYLREPHLSTGAWRTSAVTLGGLNALVTATRDQLAHKGHHEAPLQQDRFGKMLIAQETARLWTVSAAHRVGHGTVADQVAYVNLARIAVEAACLDAMRLAQRALGLGAFVQPNPVERLLRDLAVYLRQPAPDAVLTEAAYHALSANTPSA